MIDETPSGKLAGLEQQTQDYLLRRPPAFFIQRSLSFAQVPEQERIGLLQQIFPTVPDLDGLAFAALADAVAYTQRDDVACLNRYFYRQLRAELGELILALRQLLEQAQAAGDAEPIYAAGELLAYLLVEQCYWEFLSQPLVTLRFDPTVMAEAGSLIAAAKDAARDRRDWLRWHRLAANKARLGFLARDQSPILSQVFDEAISLGQLCLDHGVPLDPAFFIRRDELLHMAGLVKFFLQDPTYPNLCAHIKSPGRIKPTPGGMRLTLEAGKLIGNLSLPLLFEMEERFRRVGPQTAYLDCLALEDRLQLWIAWQGKYQGQSFSYRQLHELENLDLIFRPNQFEVALRDSARPFEKEEVADEDEDKIAFIGRGLAAKDSTPFESLSVAGRQWVMRFPTLEMGWDDRGRPVHRELSPSLSGVPWERTLGLLLARVLPDDPELQHLVVSADGPLALLPLHLAQLTPERLLVDRYRISYAPSLAFFAPAAKIRREDAPRVAVVMNSRNRLQGPIWESERLKSYLGSDPVLVLDGFDQDETALQSCLGDRDILHIATHGQSFTDTPEQTGLELSNRRTLTIRAIENLQLKPGCLVFLNACGTSRVQIRSRIDFASIANAFLAAGAATVVATFWETGDVAAALISDRFYRRLLLEGRGRLESLKLALEWLRGLDLNELQGEGMNLTRLADNFPADWTQPYRSPAHWGQFALFGEW